MKLRLKENPGEWRKQTWQALVALAVITTILHWRKGLPNAVWLGVLTVLAIIAICAWAAPQWFRGYYRASNRFGFSLAKGIGYAALVICFFLVVTPLGLILRAFGQDPLRLKRTGKEESYWNPSKPNSPLDRMF
jgi:hypothetical protein